ncbi:MAG: DsbA family protein [Rhodospirillales bacterium]
MFRRLVSVLPAAVIAIALTSVPTGSRATNAQPMTDAGKAAFEKLIHDYIMNNPTVILESVRAHQEAQAKAEQATQQQRITDMREQIENGKLSPVGGNVSGDVTLVAFFDYRCGYCKKVHDAVMNTVEKDGNIKLVYKEFPILGPDSVAATRAALGVFYTMKDKYIAFNDALMRSKGGLNEGRVLQIAESIGLDAKAVRKSMEDPRIDIELGHTMALAEALNIRGTPAFIINRTLVPGAVDQQTLEDMVKEARKG